MKREVTFDFGAKAYHLEIEKAHPYVISGGSPGRVRRIAEYLDQVDRTMVSDRGLATVHGVYKGLLITAFSTGMGPASVSIVLPEVIEACDDPNMVIIRIGTSGALQNDLKVGDFAVTTEVYRAETTSDKIMGEGYVARASPDVREALAEAARKHKAPFQSVYVGRTKVTNDIYFDALASKGKNQGDVLAVSMEFSVYCALRDRYNRDFGRNIRVGNLLVVSDSLANEEDQIDMTEFKRRQTEIERAHITAGLEALLNISRQQIT